jgi:serine 3-dehydrogenase
MTPKLVFVTGSTSGIGRATAKAFAQQGADLLLLGRRQDRLEALARELKDVEVHTWQADVRDLRALLDGAAQRKALIDRCDVLVNNAGLAVGRDPLQESAPQDWDEMIDTNVKGLLYTTHLVLGPMVRRGRGHIVNLGSITGRRVYRGGTVYAATKFAVRAITESLRLDLHGTGVRVTGIEPGQVETEFSKVRFRGDESKAADVYAGYRPLSPDDVAEAIVWCVSRPEHVDVQDMLIMPTDQSGPTTIHKRGD